MYTLTSDKSLADKSVKKKLLNLGSTFFVLPMLTSSISHGCHVGQFFFFNQAKLIKHNILEISTPAQQRKHQLQKAKNNFFLLTNPFFWRRKRQLIEAQLKYKGKFLEHEDIEAAINCHSLPLPHKNWPVAYWH